MLFRTQSAAVYGIDADLVDIEVDLTPARTESDSPSSVTIVGLPDAAVRESRERIRAAITNCAFFFPFHKTTINLAPADVRKEGASFDLPIALGILGANGDLGDAEGLTDTLSVGELSLDGRVRPIRGALPIAIRARDASVQSPAPARRECEGSGGRPWRRCLCGREFARRCRAYHGASFKQSSRSRSHLIRQKCSAQTSITA